MPKRLGSRAAVDQCLSRLVRRDQLLRAGRGLYVRPIERLSEDVDLTYDIPRHRT